MGVDLPEGGAGMRGSRAIWLLSTESFLALPVEPASLAPLTRPLGSMLKRILTVTEPRPDSRDCARFKCRATAAFTLECQFATCYLLGAPAWA